VWSACRTAFDSSVTTDERFDGAAAHLVACDADDVDATAGLLEVRSHASAHVVHDAEGGDEECRRDRDRPSARLELVVE